MPSIFHLTTPLPPPSPPDSDDDEGEMDLDDLASGPSAGPSVVGPGDYIASAKDWMRGHGTFVEEGEQGGDGGGGGGGGGEVRGAVAGTVERVNKLVSVRALRGRYRPEVGDLVVGRVSEVQPKRWLVDCAARSSAILTLGSVNLPGGIQRRKLESDELQMRGFFQEGDVLVAEVQAFFGDGAMSLHTRSLKYGKLRNGILVKVPSQLIVRLKSHFHSLACGADLIVGMNGHIWVSAPRPQAGGGEGEGDGQGMDGLEGEGMYSDTNDSLSPSTLAILSRLSILISLLAASNLAITDTIISEAYDISLEVTSGGSGGGGGVGGGGRGKGTRVVGPEKSVGMLLRPDVRERIVARLVSGR